MPLCFSRTRTPSICATGYWPDVFFQRFDHVKRAEQTRGDAGQSFHFDSSPVVRTDLNLATKARVFHVPTHLARLNGYRMTMRNHARRVLHRLDGGDGRRFPDVALGDAALDDGREGLGPQRHPAFGHRSTVHGRFPTDVDDALNFNRVLLSTWLHDRSPPFSTGGPAA